MTVTASAFTPEQARAYADEIRRAYDTALTTMMQAVADRLADGIDEPGWAEAKLAEIQAMQRQVTQEIETLTGGLNDTIKAIAEELEIKPGVLKKAIKLAHKAEFGKAKQDHELLETILETVGKTL
jgi:endonuclease III